MRHRGYQQDLVEIAQQEYAEGRIGRRDFLWLAAALGAAPALTTLGARSAAAETKEITIANFGGEAIKHYATAWGDPFTADTGIKVKIDGSGPLPGKIRSQVDAKNVIWDVADGSGYYSTQLGPTGYLEPIDYTIVDKKNLWEGWAWPYAAGDYAFSYVLAYDTTKVKGVPSWADFFDTKKYPGKRATFKYFEGTGEQILLGDGVAPDKLYPMDMKRVVAKAKSLGKDLILWESGAASQQLFLDGEVVMASIWHTRAGLLKRDTKGRVDFTWNQAIRCPGAWVIPKGAKDPKVSNQFIAASLKPERQLKLLELLGNGPSNPAASAMAKGEIAAKDPINAANLKVEITRDEEWYATSYDDALDKWLEGLAG